MNQTCQQHSCCYVVNIRLLATNTKEAVSLCHRKVVLCSCIFESCLVVSSCRQKTNGYNYETFTTLKNIEIKYMCHFAQPQLEHSKAIVYEKGVASPMYLGVSQCKYFATIAHCPTFATLNLEYIDRRQFKILRSTLYTTQFNSQLLIFTNKSFILFSSIINHNLIKNYLKRFTQVAKFSSKCN